MQKKNIIHHWGFRLLTPPVYGLFIYVLVLLFFDSPGQLATNFFSIEYIICAVLCYVNFGLWRFIVKRCESWCLLNLQKGILLQTGITFLAGILVTLLLLTLYFKLLVGLVDFRSELIIFGSLLGLSALLYNSVYFSQFLLEFQHTDIILEQEKLKNEALERWQNYQYRINPSLFYQSLEHLIGLTYHHPAKADELLTQLSQLYRKVLEHSEEIISIQNEVEHVKLLAVVLHELYPDQLSIEINTDHQSEYYTVAGIVMLHLQKTVSENIISTLQPLKIKVNFQNGKAIITYKENKKLNPDKHNMVNIQGLTNKLTWYTSKTINKSEKTNKEKIISIPLVKID